MYSHAEILHQTGLRVILTTGTRTHLHLKTLLFMINASKEKHTEK